MGGGGWHRTLAPLVKAGCIAEGGKKKEGKKKMKSS